MRGVERAAVDVVPVADNDPEVVDGSLLGTDDCLGSAGDPRPRPTHVELHSLYVAALSEFRYAMKASERG